MAETRRRAIVHRATVLEVSSTGTPSQLRLACRKGATVPVEADVAAWRASFQEARVTCQHCLRQRAAQQGAL